LAVAALALAALAVAALAVAVLAGSGFGCSSFGCGGFGCKGFDQRVSTYLLWQRSRADIVMGCHPSGIMISGRGPAFQFHNLDGRSFSELLWLRSKADDALKGFVHHNEGYVV
jgi:hypothetical protein